jgi:predicted transcriptional regulator
MISMPRSEKAPTKGERLTITLGEDQRRQIAAIAQRRRTSAASIIRWAIDEYIARDGAGALTGSEEKQ